MEVKVTFDVKKKCTIKDILDDLKIKEQRLCIDINGEYKETLSEDYVLESGDTITISPEFQGGDGRGTKIITSVISIAAIVASAGIAAAPAGTVGLTGLQAAGLKTAILVGSALINAGIIAITRPTQDVKNDQNSSDRPDYSLSTGSNGIRVNSPLPIVMGKMRIFPDISSKPYNEYKYASTLIFEAFIWDDETYTENSINFLNAGSIIVNAVVFNYLSINAGVDDWVRYGDVTHTYYDTRSKAESTIDPVDTTSLTQLSLVFVTSNSVSDPAFTNVFIPFQDLKNNGLSATPLTTSLIGSDYFTNFTRFRYEESLAFLNLLNEVVKQVVNYGYGDYIISDSKIIHNDSVDYRDFQIISNTETQTNFPLQQAEPSFVINPGSILSEFFSYVNGHVDTISGGLLSNNDSFQYPNNWVVRQGPTKNSTFGIQIDIEGRILRSDPVNGGVQPITREFQFQYREVGGSWTNFTQATWETGTLPFYIDKPTLNNLYRETLYVDNLPAGNYEVRARKVDADEEDKDNVCEIYLKRVRFYQQDENYLYPAQNRKSIIVNSNAQIYGTLDRLSSLVSAKCWAWNGSNYTWQETSNPADWFLYFARGGFLNTSADGSFVYPFSPTVGWVNSADHVDNSERLFGAGKKDSQIDFDSIQAWWQFCDNKNLTFNAVLDSKKNPLDVLYDIASVGRGSVTYTNGKIGVIWEDVNQPVVAVFTPDNIIKDSFSINYLNQKTADKIIAQYIDADQEYSSQNVEAVVPGVVNPTEEASINLWGVTNKDQAQRAVNLLASRQLYQKRNVSFSTDAEGMMFSRGDVIYLSHDVSQWGYSGRIIDIEYNATNVISIAISCAIDESITHVHIRNTHNEIFTYQVSISNNRIVFITPWLIQNAPFYLDKNGTQNPSSLFPESYLDDFIVLAGNVALPGKKLRIFEINSKSMNEIEILCIDEEDAMYAHEYDTSYVPAQNVERIKAKVFNVAWVKTGASQGYITWDRDGCKAVSILISVNGGSAIPYIDNQSATIYSNQAWLYYGDGTHITATISPVVVDTPFESISETVSFTI